MKAFRLNTINISDDFPLIISFNGKALWRSDKNKKLELVRIINREEDTCSFTAIVDTELKPSENEEKVIEVLKYFFESCTVSLSPQCAWGTDDCDYYSLFKDFDVSDKQDFERVFDKMIQLFPELAQEQRMYTEIPKKETLRSVVAQIEIGYPVTWTVDYIEK